MAIPMMLTWVSTTENQVKLSITGNFLLIHDIRLNLYLTSILAVDLLEQKVSSNLQYFCGSARL
jgi:hypothetical protein